MRNWNRPLCPDSVLVVPNELSTPGFTKEAGRTYLHLACFNGDVLLLCEYLRCGATADKTDSAGISPLYLALSQMAAFTFCVMQHSMTQQGIRHNDGTLWQEVDFRHAIAQYAWLARILVEQHADVNREVDGISVLHLACRAANWETIALLLEHGANLKAPLTSYFTSLAERKRFSTLTHSNCRLGSRPARICPCWSGKTISDCHGKAPQPYPLHFICVCGSSKTYDRCCSRKTPVVEEWSKDSQRIIHGFDTVSDKKMPESMRQLQQTLRDEMERLAELRALMGAEDGSTTTVTGISLQQTPNSEISKLVSIFLAGGLIDPAFAYAVTHSAFFPK
jgi:Ankyrin repeat